MATPETNSPFQKSNLLELSNADLERELQALSKEALGFETEKLYQEAAVAFQKVAELAQQLGKPEVSKTYAQRGAKNLTLLMPTEEEPAVVQNGLWQKVQPLFKKVTLKLEE